MIFFGNDMIVRPSKLFRDFMSNQLLSKLTPREKECLILCLKGKTAKESGKVLQISFRTVEEYINNLKVKLGCRHKRELYALFQNNSLN
jgi:DNA-binding CsgD family transcriptional regulator